MEYGGRDMGEIVFGGVVPHPPLVVPEVGKQHVRKVQATRNALQEFARHVTALKPDLLLMISPHAPAARDALTIFTQPRLQGNLSMFQAPEVCCSVENDVKMVEQILKAAAADGIPIIPLGRDYTELDHGVMVPLSYLREAGLKSPMVIIGLGLLPYPDLFKFGQILRQVIMASEQRVAIVASGDLSHRLLRGAPAGYSPLGKEFDRQVVQAFMEFAPHRLMNLDSSLIEEAGECGLRPIIILFGALTGSAVKTKVLSYEGPFGVGYMVAQADIMQKGEDAHA